MTYISSVSYSAQIDACRLMTIDRLYANDFKLHTLKRRYLLSKLGEISNDLDRLEFEMLDIVERKNAGLLGRNAIKDQNHRIDQLIEYRKNILRGLDHEDKVLSSFGENKPFIGSRIYLKQLKEREDADTTIDDLNTARKYVLSTIGEINEVLNKIDVVIADLTQQNDRERINQCIEDRITFRSKRKVAFIRLIQLDRRIAETKK